VIDLGVTETLFSTPSQQQTEEYISGRFGCDRFDKGLAINHEHIV
jgi:hypothetical protein